MNLKQVETFYWAAKLGSFVKAARHLNATQSAVSMRIQELESRLGLVLFQRAHRSATLTSHGIQLLPLAEKLLATSQEISQLSSSMPEISGHVRVGVAEVVAMTWLPDFLRSLRDRHPKLQVEIEVALSHVIEEKLIQGVIDIAFAPCELSKATFVHISLGTQTFRWMSSPEMAGRPERITPSDIVDLPVIVTSRESQFRGTTPNWINGNAVRFGQPTICNTFTIAARMAISGLGIAFLPIECFGPALEKDELRLIPCDPEAEPLEHFVIRRNVSDDPVHLTLETAAVEMSNFSPA